MPFSSARRRLGASPEFTLFVLTLTFTVGFIDRQLLNLLVEPIKRDFGLSDIGVSLLQGAAFSVAYLLMSPVFGRLVDTRNRCKLLLCCLVVWTTFTASCGFAGTFLMLFAARSVVGAAEAGLTPSAWSILTGRFTQQQLPRAFSIYHLGTYIGSGLAMILGGAAIAWVEGMDLTGLPVIGALRPWQVTFLLVSLLGVPTALLVIMLIEPPRVRESRPQIAPPPLGEAFAVLWHRRSFYIPFYFGIGMAIVPIYAFPAWIPTVAIRQFDVSVTTVGFHYGTVAIISGSLGVLAAPMLGRLGTRLGYGADINIRAVAWSAAAVLVCCIALGFRQSYAMTIAIAGITGFLYAVPTPLAASALQIATPEHVRGLASGIYIVVITLMGLGVAPLAVAFVTENILADETRVGDALAIICGVCAAASSIALFMTLSAYRKLTLE